MPTAALRTARRCKHGWPLNRSLSLTLCLMLLGWVGATIAEEPDLQSWRQTRVLAAPEAVQAAAADARHVYAITNDRIARYNRETGERIDASVGAAQHLNSGYLWAGRLYAAHSNYPRQPEESEIRVLDLATMRLTTHHRFDRPAGSLTWAIRRDGHWWCNFARYGEQNKDTYLAEYDDQWKELRRFTYPPSVISKLGAYSLSGGLWREDQLLVTDHDHGVLYVLALPASGSVLRHLGNESVPFTGQGIAIDAKTGGLVGINRAKRQVVFAESDAGK